MQSVTAKERKHRVTVNSDLEEKYSHSLNLYKEPPLIQLCLYEFEEFASERLRALRVLELVTLKGGTKNYEEWKEAVKTELNKQGLKSYQKLCISGFAENEPDKFEVRKRDHISHFILRIAFCHSEENRRWLISRELELFKLKWQCLSKKEQDNFLKLNDIHYTKVSDEVIRNLSDGFLNITNDYYAVEWISVADLVRNRKVYLDRGKAFITSADFIFVLGSRFRSALSHALVTLSFNLHLIKKDERLNRLVNNLHHVSTGKTYVVNNNNRSVSLQSLESLSKTSYPLCMRQLHSALKTQHHLRHSGRQQFSLFLKGIGLSLEDAMIFWRAEFTKKMDPDQFEKRHAYNIRHNYGKEGKRTNYTPYSCAKIIAGSVGPGEYHGCPFKHSDIPIVKQTLSSYNISSHGIEEIINYVNMRQYQLACAKYFELTHNVPLVAGFNHPNQYFEESQKLLSVGKANSSNYISPAPQKAPVSNNSQRSRTMEEELMDDSVFEGINFDSTDNV